MKVGFPRDKCCAKVDEQVAENDEQSGPCMLGRRIITFSMRTEK